MYLVFKDINYEVNSKVKLFVSLNNVSVCDENKNILMVNDDILKPIIDVNIKQFSKEYYIITNEKPFAKRNKYLLIEKIYDLNNKMILVCKNQNQENLTLRIDKNEDFFNGMLIYTKYKKIKLNSN